MRNRARKRGVSYYVLVDKRLRKAKIYTTLQGAIDYIGTYRNEILRGMDDNGVYESEYYTLYRGVLIEKCQKGFKLSPYSKSISYE